MIPGLPERIRWSARPGTEGDPSSGELVGEGQGFLVRVRLSKELRPEAPILLGTGAAAMGQSFANWLNYEAGIVAGRLGLEPYRPQCPENRAQFVAALLNRLSLSSAGTR